MRTAVRRKQRSTTCLLPAAATACACASCANCTNRFASRCLPGRSSKSKAEAAAASPSASALPHQREHKEAQRKETNN
jgi:hypothetical protein